MVKIFGIEFGKKKEPEVTHTEDLMAYNGLVGGQGGVQNAIFDGEKFDGGFGPTSVHQIDYWTLRARSAQLFNENLYARGIIRRLVTNIINTGLSPEACPDEQILGLPEDSLADWTEMTENRFGLWGKNPQVCDWLGVDTFGAIQRKAELEALVEGDVLVVLRHDAETNLPKIQLIRGSLVRDPIGNQPRLVKGNTIKHGVEHNKRGVVVAYWVDQDDLTSRRIPVRGRQSGRKISWLLFGTDKRMDECRGQPLLSIIMQSLKEIDRYRDSTQRKATLNSILAMFIRKGEDKMGTLPISGGAVRRDQTTETTNVGGTRNFNIADHIPGLIMEELQHGEEPVGFNSAGTDVNFGNFEQTILASVAWSLEIPPEIMTLTFSKNYSASQAAINEMKIAINLKWGDRGENMCDPVYTDWLLSEVLNRNIEAPGLLDAWRDPREYAVFGAWTATDWYGAIKPSTDMLKQAKGSKLIVDEGWSTNAREARITTGTKFSKNMKRLKRENEMKVEAARPMAEFKQEFGQTVEEADMAALAEDTIQAYLEDMGLGDE